MVVAAFVAPYLLETTTRFIAAAAQLPGVRLAVITCEPAERLPPVLKQHLQGHWQVDDALDPGGIAEAVKGLSRQMGPVERVVAALEQLQVPVAQVREELGIEGMDVATALNVRNKARMKSVLHDAGIPCARYRLVHHPDEALAFAAETGFPLVAKPPAGAGSQATFRLDDAEALRSWLSTAPPTEDQPALLEEFLTGEEHSFDAVTVHGHTGWWSISDYQPGPLEVLRNPWIQWVVLMPRDISTPRYQEIGRVGPAALHALGVRDALCHLEWFGRPDGSVAVSEVAARPPGGGISAMIGYAYDMNVYSMWGELMFLGGFQPRERKYATGTAYLRGQGRGRVAGLSGVEEVQRQIGHLVVEARLPRPGQPASGEYSGEGTIIVRHPDTEVVQDALNRIITGIRVQMVETL
ncbi:MAG: acetyl-CoA carboxylase biotin carboxylase subunit family protein [Actinomycetes bacterium]